MRIIQLVIKISFTTKLAQVLTLLNEQLNKAVKSIHHYNLARRRGGSKGSNEPPSKFDNGGLKYK